MTRIWPWLVLALPGWRSALKTARCSIEEKEARYSALRSLPWLFECDPWGTCSDSGQKTDVRLWHKADMLNALTHVRFWGQRRYGADFLVFPLMTQVGCISKP